MVGWNCRKGTKKVGGPFFKTRGFFGGILERKGGPIIWFDLIKGFLLFRRHYSGFLGENGVPLELRRFG